MRRIFQRFFAHYARYRRPTGRNWAQVILVASCLTLIGSGMVPFLFADVKVTSVPVAVKAPAPRVTCITPGEKNFSYHNFRGGLEGPHAFGPPLKGKGAASKWQDFMNRLCGTDRHGPDRALWVAVRDALGHPVTPHLSNEQWRQEVQDFLDNTSNVALRNRAGSFADHTYMMTGRKSVIVVQVAPRTTTQRFLVVKLKDGSKIWLRIACGGQPYVH